MSNKEVDSNERCYQAASWNNIIYCFESLDSSHLCLENSFLISYVVVSEEKTLNNKKII